MGSWWSQVAEGVAIIQQAIRNRFSINWLTLLAALMELTFPSQLVLEQATGWRLPGPHPSMLSTGFGPTCLLFSCQRFAVCRAGGMMAEPWL